MRINSIFYYSTNFLFFSNKHRLLKTFCLFLQILGSRFNLADLSKVMCFCFFWKDGSGWLQRVFHCYWKYGGGVKRPPCIILMTSGIFLGLGRWSLKPFWLEISCYCWLINVEYSKQLGIVEHLLVVSRLGWVEEWAGNRAILLQAATVTLRICHKR